MKMLLVQGHGKKCGVFAAPSDKTVEGQKCSLGSYPCLSTKGTFVYIS